MAKAPCPEPGMLPSLLPLGHGGHLQPRCPAGCPGCPGVLPPASTQKPAPLGRALPASLSHSYCPFLGAQADGMSPIMPEGCRIKKKTSFPVSRCFLSPPKTNITDTHSVGGHASASGRQRGSKTSTPVSPSASQASKSPPTKA